MPAGPAEKQPPQVMSNRLAACSRARVSRSGRTIAGRTWLDRAGAANAEGAGAADGGVGNCTRPPPQTDPARSAHGDPDAIAKVVGSAGRPPEARPAGVSRTTRSGDPIPVCSTAVYSS